MSKEKDRKITILINNTHYEAPKPLMTGLEIKTLCSGSFDSWLILVVESPDEVAGGDDIQIHDQQVVELKSGMRFRIVTPATFGQN